jgi:hypothetical protein
VELVAPSSIAVAIATATTRLTAATTRNLFDTCFSPLLEFLIQA